MQVPTSCPSKKKRNNGTSSSISCQMVALIPGENDIFCLTEKFLNAVKSIRLSPWPVIPFRRNVLINGTQNSELQNNLHQANAVGSSSLLRNPKAGYSQHGAYGTDLSSVEPYLSNALREGKKRFKTLHLDLLSTMTQPEIQLDGQILVKMFFPFLQLPSIVLMDRNHGKYITSNSTLLYPFAKCTSKT